MSVLPRICLQEYLNPVTGSSFEVWQEANGDVVPYVDGTPMLNAKRDPVCTKVALKTTFVDQGSSENCGREGTSQQNQYQSHVIHTDSL